MFRALLPHPQDSLHERHSVYCVRVVIWLLQGLEWNCVYNALAASILLYGCELVHLERRTKPD
jgi:hypothetical protein